MRERLRAVDSKRIAQLISDLDAGDFDRREAASKELAALGALAGAALRKTLEQNPSRKSVRDIMRLLPSLDKWVVTDPDVDLPPCYLGLECIGMPEARAVLDDLAGGPGGPPDPGGQAALDFLDRARRRRPPTTCPTISRPATGGTTSSRRRGGPSFGPPTPCPASPRLPPSAWYNRPPVRPNTEAPDAASSPPRPRRQPAGPCCAGRALAPDGAGACS